MDEQEFAHALLLVDGVQRAARLAAAEGRAGLDGEVVGRDVLDARLEQLREAAAERLLAEARDAEDEVGCQIAEPRAARLVQRLQRLAGRVAAVHHPQAVVVEGLDADGEAVDARAAQSGEVVGRQVVGVGLDGHLLENGVGAPLEDAVDEALQRLGRAERGGPAAEVEGAERLAVELAQTGVELAEHRLGHRLQELEAGALVEVAVGAEALAEGDVEVDAGHNAPKIGKLARFRMDLGRIM